MRRSTQRKLNNLGLVAMVIGALVIGGFALKLLLGTAPDVPEASETLGPIESELVPSDTPTPFTTPSPSSTALGSGNHEVKITVKSDGAIRVGYKFTGGKEGLKDATKTFSITETVPGAAGLAQVGVQLVGGATSRPAPSRSTVWRSPPARPTTRRPSPCAASDPYVSHLA